MKPVAEKITEIEERKKTTEYEGYCKEATATGSLDLEAVTCLEKMSLTVGPGGFIDKENQLTNSHKILAGTNHGSVVLIDTAGKRAMDTFQIPSFIGRRIIDISTATIDWVGTQLTYVAVVARGSPIVQVLIFKNSENKLRQLYSINTCPEITNPETPEANPGQTYRDFPSKVKLSLDFSFLAVTTCNGAVQETKV